MLRRDHHGPARAPWQNQNGAATGCQEECWGEERQDDRMGLDWGGESGGGSGSCSAPFRLGSGGSGGGELRGGVDAPPTARSSRLVLHPEHPVILSKPPGPVLSAWWVPEQWTCPGSQLLASAEAGADDARQRRSRAKNLLRTPFFAWGSAGNLCGAPEKVVGEIILLSAPPPALWAVHHALRGEKIRCLAPTTPCQPKTSRCRASKGAGYAQKQVVDGTAELPNSQKHFLAKNKAQLLRSKASRRRKSSCSCPARGCERSARPAGQERELFSGQRPVFFGQQPRRRAKPSSRGVSTRFGELTGRFCGFPGRNSGVPVAFGHRDRAGRSRAGPGGRERSRICCRRNSTCWDGSSVKRADQGPGLLCTTWRGRHTGSARAARVGEQCVKCIHTSEGQKLPFGPPS